MPSYIKPGVYIEETLNPTQPIPTNGAPSNAVFVGVTDRGPVTVKGTKVIGVPTLVRSWSDFVTRFSFGTALNTFTSAADANSETLKYALKSYFENGGGQAYVLRVVNTDAVAASLTLVDTDDVDALTITANSVGTWGNNIYVDIVASAAAGYFDLVVYYYEGSGSPSTSNIVERFNQLNMDPTSTRYAVTAVSSEYLTLTRPAGNIDDNNPDVIAAIDLGSGTAGSAGTTAPSIPNDVLANIDPLQGPLVLNWPDLKFGGTVNYSGLADNILGYCSTRGDVFAVIDAQDASVATVLSTINAYNTSYASYGAAYYPRIVVSDPLSRVGGTKTIAPGGAVTAMYINADSQKGAFQSPAGVSTRLNGVVSVASLSNTEFSAIAANAVALNVIRHMPGAGICVMGARTLSTSPDTKYVSVRRSLQYINRSLNDMTQFAIFEPNDEVLWGRIRSVVDSFLYGYWKKGGLKGATTSQAYYVKCDASLNSPSVIDAGELRIEVGVALQRPAEFIVIKIGQMDGVTTVTTL